MSDQFVAIINKVTFKTDNLFKNFIRPVIDSSKEAITKLAAAVVRELGLQDNDVKKGMFIAPESCVISEEEIKKCSLLNGEDQDGDLEINNLLSMGMALLADGYLTKEKDLENVDNLKNFELWEQLLASLNEEVEGEDLGNTIVSNLKNGLAQLKKNATLNRGLICTPQVLIDAECLKQAQQVQNLKKGESTLLEGVIISKDSKANVIYEIARGTDNKFTLTVYTTSKLLAVESFKNDDKSRMIPMVRYSQIPEEVLLFNSDGVVRPTFIQSLVELTLRGLSKPTQPNLEATQRCLEYLAKFKTRVHPSECGVVTPHRSSATGPAAVKALIRKHTGHLAIYKQLMFHLKLKLMIQLYRSLEKQNYIDATTSEAQLSRRLLVHAAKKMLLRVTKLSEGVHGYDALITSEVALQARATAHDILSRINKTEVKIAEKSKDVRTADLSKTTTRHQRLGREQQDIYTYDEEKNPRRNNYRLPNLTLKIESQDPDGILEFMKAGLNDIAAADSVYGHTQIHHIVDSLPVPGSDAIWNAMSKEQLSEALTNLHNLLTLYQNHVTKDTLERRYATLYPLYAMICDVSCRIDDLTQENVTDPLAKLSNYSFPLLTTCLEHEGLQFYNRKEFERIEQAVAFMKNATADKIFTLFTSEVSTTVEGKSVGNSSNGIYWHALLDSDAALKEAVVEYANVRFPDLTDEQIRADYNTMKAARDAWVTRNRAYQIYYNAYGTYQDKHWKWEREGKVGSEPRPPAYVERPGFEEPEPRWKVNLPLETKLTLLMQELNSNSLLKDNGFDHINHLRNSIEIVKKLATQVHPKRDSLLTNARRLSPYTTEAEINGLLPTSISTKEDYALEANSKNRVLNREHSIIMNANEAVRQANKWQQDIAEGNALQKHLADSHTVEARLFRTLSQWELTPNQMIFELQKDLKILTDPSLQALIYRLFFRSPIVNGVHRLGAGDLICTDEALFNNAKRFINKGLNYFLNTNFNLEGARFFLDLSFFLNKYLADAGEHEKAAQFSQLATLNQALQRDDLRVEQKAKLQHYKVLQYSVQQTFSQEDYTDLFASWTSYKFYRETNDQWKFPLQDKLCEKFVLDATIKCFADETIDYNKLAVDILKNLDVDITALEGQWKKDPLLGAPYLTNGVWKIDLLEGTVHNSAGRLGGISENFEWESQSSFKRLFGEKTSFIYRSNGDNQVAFSDSKLGSFRILKRSSGFWGNRSYYIQKQMYIEGKGWQWFQYVAPDRMEDFPASLAKDYAYWVPVKGKFVASDTTIKGVFTTLDKHNVSYLVEKKGTILQADAGRLVPKEDSYEIDFLESSDLLTAIRDFDRLKNVLTYRKKDRLEKLVFSRYQSIDGNALMFERSGNDLIWSENKGFKLPKEKPTQLLGTINNYLYLESTKPSDKAILLVPYLPIGLQSASPIADGILNTQTTETEHRLTGTDKYFVYNIENGKITPSSLEARLHLAYIYQSQLRYEEANALLRSVTLSENLSEISLQILVNIMDLQRKEGHPDAAIVKLNAYRLYARQRDKDAKEPVSKYCKSGHEYNELLSCYYDILNKTNALSETLRLSIKEEVELISKLDKDWQTHGFLLQMGNSARAEAMYSTLRERSKYLVDGERKEKLSPQFSSTVETSNLYSGTPEWVSYIDKPVQPLEQTYNNKAAYERAKAQYENDLITLPGKLAWFTDALAKRDEELDVSTSSLNNTGRIQTDGDLFVKVYRTAKLQGSEYDGAKQALIFKLMMLRSEDKKNAYLDCLLAILLYPEKFPELVNPKKDPIRIFEFLYDVGTSYSTVIKYSPKVYTAAPETPYVAPNVNKENYKISVESLFDVKKPSKEDNESTITPLNLKFSKQEQRWQKLQEWTTAYIKDEEGYLVPEYSDFTFTFNKDWLSNKEETYAATLEKDLKTIKEDYDKGAEINKQTKIKYISSDSCDNLLEASEKQLKEIRQDRAKKEKELLEKVNRLSNDPLKRQSELARFGSKANTLLNFQDCVNALLTYQQEAFKEKNSNLDDSKLIDELANLVLEIEGLKSYEAQVERVQKLSKEIHAIDILSDSSGHNTTRRSLCQRLFNELEAQYHFENMPEEEGFTAEEKMILHVYAGQSGVIPHKKQTDLIRKMLTLSETDPEKFMDIVIQLIMGGGKTSVIATIILFIAARRKNRSAFFIVPPSLHETVAANFSESVMNAFGKEVISINLVREDFTIYKLRQITNQLEIAEKEDFPVIISAVTLQGLELEMFSAACRIRDLFVKRRELERQIAETTTPSYRRDLLAKLSNANETIQELFTKGHEIAKIVKFSRSNADGLLDEVDVLLCCFLQVNFVDGEKIPVDPLRNQMLLEVHKAFNSPTIKVPTLPNQPVLRDVLRLHSNQQSLLPEADYLTHVAPIVAHHMVNKFKPLSDKIGTIYRDSYVRYASGQMPHILQEYADKNLLLTRKELETHPELKAYALNQLKNDIQFLQFIKKLSKGNEKDREAAELIGLSKHFIAELSPCTLSKVGGRNYGLSPSKDTPGKIIPYLGVQTPATTEFGYHWEAANYHYQLGVTFKPEKEQILLIAESALASARYYMERNGEKLEETAEYIDFQKLFGIGLDKIHDDAAMQEAIETISQNHEKLLEMQYELVAIYATYATRRLCSNGFCLLDLLPSKLTMSGTPWNVEGFEKSLAERFFADIGTEGRFFHKLAERAKGKTNRKGEPNEGIYEIDFRENDVDNPFTFKEFLTKLYETHSHPTKLRGIIEADGLFKSFGKNIDVARDWMEFIAAKQKEEADNNVPEAERIVDHNIEGVLFFHNDPGQTQPNTLYVWRRGATAPDRIGSSTVAALEAKGLVPSNYVVYFDERHTTGTDFKLPDDAYCIMTVGPMQLYRTQAQGIARERGNLLEQQIDILVSKESRKNMINGGKTLEDIVTTAAKYQSIRKTQAMVRFFGDQIHHIFRRHSAFEFAKLFDTPNIPDNFEAIVNTHEPQVVTFFKEQPWLQFGSLNNITNTKEMLQELLKQKHELFKKRVTDEKILHDVQTDVDSLSKWIEITKCLPETWKDLATAFQAGFEVNQEISIEIAEEISIEIEQEIEFELQNYERGISSDFRKEYSMSYGHFNKLVNSLYENESNADAKSLKRQLQSYRYQYNNKKIEYDKAFDAPLYGTEAYFKTLNTAEVIPVFHKLQRPAKQILVVRDNAGTLRYLFLSEHEARDVSLHLKSYYEKQANNPEETQPSVWLIQPDGSFLVESEGMQDLDTPEDNPELLNALIEINAFNGSVDFLDKEIYRDDVEDWLAKNAPEKIRFLKLRTLRDPLQKQIFCTSVPIVTACGKEVAETNRVNVFNCKLRQEWEKNRQGSYDPSTDWPKEEVSWRMKTLDPATKMRKFRNLKVDFVKFLGLDWNKRDTDHDTRLAIDAIQNEKKFDSEHELKEYIERLNKRQFAALREFHGGYISADQIQWVPPSHIPYIKYGSQIVKNHGERNVEYLLSKEQAIAIDEEQAHLIQYINPEYYSAFEQEWQVQAIPLAYLDKVEGKNAEKLSREQIRHIFYTFAEEKTEVSKRQIENFHPSHYSWVQGDYIEFIPDRHLDCVVDSQIAEIRNKDLIPRLEAIAAENEDVEKGLWTSWIAPEMAKYITLEQLPYLATADQIANIVDDFVDQLKISQVKMIAAHQVQHLKSPEKIKACPNALVKEMKESQIPYITSEQVPYLRGEQIGWIKDENMFQYLLAEDSSGFINQMPFINEAQFGWIKNNQVKGLTNDLLLKVYDKERTRWKELRQHISSKQVQGFDCEDLLNITPRKFIKAHLIEKQVPLLTTERNVRSCPDVLVQKLSVDQVKQIKPEQVPHLKGEKQVQAIPLSEDFVHKLEKKQFKDISEDQGRLLSKAQIAKMDDIKHVEKLPIERILDITEKQVGLVRGKERIQKIPCTPEFVKAMVKEQFKDMTEEQVRHLTKDQIAEMDSNVEIGMLTKSQWKHLGSKGYALLNEEQVRELLSDEECMNDPDVLSKIPFIKSELIYLAKTKKAIERITDHQVSEFGVDGFNKLDNKHPLWQRVSREIVKEIVPEKIHNVAKDKLIYVRKPEVIKKIPMRDYVHLKKDQLKHVAKSFWSAVYAFGVVTLGVVACAVSLVAYTLFPFIWACSKQTAWRYHAALKPNLKRPIHLFTEYLPAMVA